MTISPFHMVYITTKNLAEAESIGRALVSERLAACVNIIEGMKSIYWWQGKIDSSDEVILIAKTSDQQMPNLIDAVKKLHSYTVPCIVSLPLLEGNPDYLEWLDSSSRSPARGPCSE